MLNHLNATPRLSTQTKDDPTALCGVTFVKMLQITFTEGTNNKLRQQMGNWYRGRISQSWNQVFSPANHKIYSFETEPHQTDRVYE
jgi:hypothetical protein